jgi:thyroxine 5-deiodinase
MWVDSMSNGANLAYGALPERLVVIQDGAIVYYGGEGPDHYDLTELRGFLAKLA